VKILVRAIVLFERMVSYHQ